MTLHEQCSKLVISMAKGDFETYPNLIRFGY